MMSLLARVAALAALLCVSTLGAPDTARAQEADRCYSCNDAGGNELCRRPAGWAPGEECDCAAENGKGDGIACYLPQAYPLETKPPIKTETIVLPPELREGGSCGTCIYLDKREQQMSCVVRAGTPGEACVCAILMPKRQVEEYKGRLCTDPDGNPL